MVVVGICLIKILDVDNVFLSLVIYNDLYIVVKKLLSLSII